jgi:hypothetical protein
MFDYNGTEVGWGVPFYMNDNGINDAGRYSGSYITLSQALVADSVQGDHKSSDGTAGTNTSFDVCTDCSGTIVTVTVKDGLITSVT